MGISVDRSKKRIQPWKKAIIQFSLCFVMGFFTGFAPSSTTSIFFSGHDAAAINASIAASGAVAGAGLVNWSRMTTEVAADGPTSAAAGGDDADADAEAAAGPLIVVTTTRSSSDPSVEGALLDRLARTLRSVGPPLLWVVVEASESASVAATARVLRGTGVMYRHLTFKREANFTDPEAESDHQRNVALGHLERHRLAGVVVFADVANVYDLGFFREIISIETFGVWPVATVSAGRKYVAIEGPVCSSSQVIGWRTKDAGVGGARRPVAGGGGEEAGDGPEIPAINVWGFAFNSSVLWDPERWGRTSPVPDTIQDSFKFVKQIVLEDDTKLKGIPEDCSRVMLWHLNAPPLLPPPRWSFSSKQNPSNGGKR